VILKISFFPNFLKMVEHYKILLIRARFLQHVVNVSTLKEYLNIYQNTELHHFFNTFAYEVHELCCQRSREMLAIIQQIPPEYLIHSQAQYQVSKKKKKMIRNRSLIEVENIMPSPITPSNVDARREERPPPPPPQSPILFSDIAVERQECLQCEALKHEVSSLKGINKRLKAEMKKWKEKLLMMKKKIFSALM
jgi:hypothetical protein